MADSRKLTILKRLTEVLEGITTGNGYDYDLGGHVFRGRRIFGAETVSPFLSILETEQGDDQANTAGRDKVVRLEWWTLHVQGWLTPDDEHPTDDLYNLLASVEKRVATQVMVEGAASYRLGGVISDIRVLPGMVLAATPEVGGVECFYLPLMLQVPIDLRDPWLLATRLG